jgi:hypothetical protein
MDTSEETVFLHIAQNEISSPTGSIYISDGFGKNYTTSIEKVARGLDLVDFEKVNSLEGVFIANKFSSHMKSKINLSK